MNAIRGGDRLSTVELSPRTADFTAMRIRPTFETARAWALVLVLAWAPLPFGSDRPWAAALLGAVTALLLLASGMSGIVAPIESPSLRPLRFPLTIAVVLAFWVLFQSMPMSGFGWQHPLWDQAADILGHSVTPSLSVARAESREHLFRLFSYAAVFFLAWQVGQRIEGAALVMRAVAAIGAGYALYGLVDYASPHPSVLWFPKRFYVDDLTSTFINRNSFATFIGLSVIAGLVLVAEILSRHTDARSRMTLTLSTLETVLWRGKWRVIGLAVATSALLLSHSRGGLAATACGCAVFLVMTAVAPSLRSAWRRSFAWLLLIGAAAVLALSGIGVVERLFETPLGDDGRAGIYAGTLSAIRDNWLFGTGFGSFKYIFPMYQTTALDTVVDLAHDDYLENMLELGVPAALLLFVAVAIIVAQCLAGVVQRRKDALYPSAAVAASALIAVHSLVDFSMQIPAVAITYAAILGVGTAQAVSSRSPGARSP